MDISYLIKFGAQEHCEKLMELGQVYMKPLSFYKNSSKDENDMYDKNEGLKSRTTNNFLTPTNIIQIDILGNGQYKNLPTTNATIDVYQFSQKFCIYSLMGIKTEITTTPNLWYFHHNLIKERDCFVLIKNPSEFFARLDSALLGLKLPFDKNFITYYDPSVNVTDLNVFNKSNKYSYQMEFRYIVENTEIQDLSVNIGTLTDIAEIHSTSIKKGLMFL